MDASAGPQIFSSGKRSFRESRKETYFHSREEKRKMRGVALNKEENLLGEKKSWQWGKPSLSISLWVARVICSIRIIASMAVNVEEIP